MQAKRTDVQLRARRKWSKRAVESEIFAATGGSTCSRDYAISAAALQPATWSRKAAPHGMARPGRIRQKQVRHQIAGGLSVTAELA
eukprot:4469606-Pleurochrysis_carterae.AAC.2